MSQTAKEKEAAAKQTFVFQASLANEYPAKQDEECGARIREADRVKTNGLAVNNGRTEENNMAEKKLVEAITSMNEDFAQWYTDVVKKAELIDYSNVKGCMVIKPAGYAIWENIQRQLDDRFKAVGVENVYMPMFIPESLLEKEKDHVEGFAPEVAWVTYGGLNPLPERMCVRPTSETLFCDFYKNDIQSYRDLPKVYNQWCSVVRWEKETRPFLRSREFLW